MSEQTNRSYRQYLQNNASSIIKNNSLSAMNFLGVSSYYSNIEPNVETKNINESDLKQQYISKKSSRARTAPLVILQQSNLHNLQQCK